MEVPGAHTPPSLAVPSSESGGGVGSAPLDQRTKLHKVSLVGGLPALRASSPPAALTASLAPLRNTVFNRESAATLNGLVRALPSPSSGPPFLPAVKLAPLEKISSRVDATVVASACFNSTLATSTSRRP